ncbi:interleukin-15-like isoform X2 [Protopterus annectens]|uniref:interleukin-15-like isoform X2 n=1 Tax=Protopterus annectens TaxID=7888 RepID=UPI001CFBE459|nr:interleukin-15-like isoform X2 [Protopterus annectens]
MAYICLQEETQGDWIWMYYCLCLILNYQFATFSSTESGLSPLLLCWLTALLPKVEANSDCTKGKLQFAIDGLLLLNKSISTHCEPDVESDPKLMLYTPEIESSPVRKLHCFLEELKVISYECENKTIKEQISRINSHLISTFNFTNQSECQQCEEFPESDIWYMKIVKNLKKKKLKDL